MLRVGGGRGSRRQKATTAGRPDGFHVGWRLRRVAAECFQALQPVVAPKPLECELERCVDGFGVNSLVVGQVVAARIDPEYLRTFEYDDQDLIYKAPLLSYVSPGRFAVVQETRSFPFPEGMKK